MRTVVSNPLERWFIVLLLIAVAARLFHFFAPPTDAHEFRQTQTLMFSASYAQGADWLAPKVWWYGAIPRIGVLEFPLYSILAYLFSLVLHSDVLIGARLVSLLLSVGAIIVFDRICALRNHPRRRTATLLFAFAPLAIFYGHAVQPEPLLLLTTLLAAYCFLRACQSGGVLWAGTAAIALACVGTIKPTVLLIVLPPMLYEGWRTKRLAVVALVIAFAGALTLGWGEHDRALLTAVNPSWHKVNSQRLVGPFNLIFDTNYAHSLAERAGFVLLPPLSVGLIASTRALQIKDAWWWLWLLGGLLSLLVFTRLNSEHFYYGSAKIAGSQTRILARPTRAALAGGSIQSGHGCGVLRGTVVRAAGLTMSVRRVPGGPTALLSGRSVGAMQDCHHLQHDQSGSFATRRSAVNRRMTRPRDGGRPSWGTGFRVCRVQESAASKEAKRG